MTQRSPNNNKQGRAPSQQQQGGFSYKQTPAHNVGMQDIGQVPNAILIAMDLPIMANEMGLWNAFKTLGPLRRIMMAKDRLSRIGWGFCFAEYENTEVNESENWNIDSILELDILELINSTLFCYRYDVRALQPL